MFNTTISLFKDLFNTKNVGYTMSFTEVCERIKKGNPELINKIKVIRESTNKEEVKSVKNSLMAIMFNGHFIDRNDDSLIEHSGLCVFDFDKYPNPETMEEEKQRLIKDKYTLLLFVSPSGNGLKVIVKIPKSDKHEHKRRFSAYKEYINSDYFDSANSNVSRVCFESYDPNVFVNLNSKLFDKILEDKGYFYNDKVPLCILEDEQKKIDIIMSFNWKKSFTDGQRNSYVFDLAGAFCEFGVNQSTAENFILNHITDNTFSEAETLTAIKSAYKKRKFDSKYFEDYEKVNKIKVKISKGTPIEEIKKELNVDEETIKDIKDEFEVNDIVFWSVKSEKGKETITINPYNYSLFLNKNGFNKYYPENSELPTFVRVIDNRVKLSSVAQIKDFVLNHLLKKELISVWNHCSKSTQLFQESHLNMIDSIYLKMLTDEKDTSFIPFRNGVVKVTENEIVKLNYIDVNGYVWENQIIDRDFEVVNSFSNDFEDFISKICNNDMKRINALETTIGYLIHTFKDKTDQKAIIFNDEEIDDNPNGGSGKSLVITALNNFRKVVKIDGKAFDPNKSDFVYQRVNLDTQILAFDDVKKNFNFEQLFSLITEGITVNRKNKDEIFIPFERSPKIVITTNYVINGVGSSHERRRHEIEFHQYFNQKRSPLSEYGRLLFDSWNKEDWAKFDNYMVKNLKLFLRNGLTSTVSINADVKRFIQSTNKEFYEWTEEDNILTNIKIYNTDILLSFMNEHKNYKDLSSREFQKWIKEYALFKNYELKKDKDYKGRYITLTINN